MAIAVGVAFGWLICWTSLRSERAALYARGKAEAEQERVALEERLSAKDERISEIQREWGQEREILARIQDENDELRAAREELDVRVAEIHRQAELKVTATIQAQDKATEQLKQAWSEKVFEQEARVRALEAELEAAPLGAAGAPGKAELEQARQQVAALEAERDQAAAELAAARAGLDRARDDASAILEQVGLAQQEAVTAREARAAAEGALTAIQTGMAELQEENARLAAANEVLAAQLESRQTHPDEGAGSAGVAALEEEVARLAAANDAYAAQFETQQSRLEQFAAAEAGLAAQREELAARREENARLAAANEALALETEAQRARIEQLASANPDLAALEEENERLVAANDAYAAQFEAQQLHLEELTAANPDLAVLREENARLAIANDAYNVQFEAQRARLEQLAAMEAELSAIRDDNARLAAANDAYAAQLDAQQLRLEELAAGGADMAAVNEENARLAAANEAFAAQLEIHQNRIEDLTAAAQNQAPAAELAALREENARLTEANEAFAAQFEQQQVRLEELATATGNATQTAEVVREEAAALQAELDDARAAVERTRAELEGARAETSRVVEESEALGAEIARLEAACAAWQSRATAQGHAVVPADSPAGRHGDLERERDEALLSARQLREENIRLETTHDALIDKLEDLDARLLEVKQAAESTRQEKDTAVRELTRLQAANAEIEARLGESRRLMQERLAVVEDNDARLAGMVRAASIEAFQANQQVLLEMTQAALRQIQTLQPAQTGAGPVHDPQAIEAAVRPLRESLERVDAALHQIDRNRAQDLDAISSQVKGLVTALRAPAPSRWNGMPLRQAVDLAGVGPYCEFAAGGDNDRAELSVQLPGGRFLSIDAKAPIGAYLESLRAPSDEERHRKLEEHAQSVRGHVDHLRGAAGREGRTPEFSVAFVPNEAFLSAALERDPGLVEEAAASQVYFASPATLIALLKVVGHGWQQEQLAEQTRAVRELGRTLYERLCGFAAEMESVTINLSRTVECYNHAVGTLENRVLRSARRFAATEAGSEQELFAPAPVDRVARAPRQILEAEAVDAPEPVEAETDGARSEAAPEAAPPEAAPETAAAQQPETVEPAGAEARESEEESSESLTQLKVALSDAEPRSAGEDAPAASSAVRPEPAPHADGI
ncbi:MAG: DNA recombination protein RmuC [Bryobacteraceae bacterium]